MGLEDVEWPDLLISGTCPFNYNAQTHSPQNAFARAMEIA